MFQVVVPRYYAQPWVFAFRSCTMIEMFFDCCNDDLEFVSSTDAEWVLYGEHRKLEN